MDIEYLTITIFPRARLQAFDAGAGGRGAASPHADPFPAGEREFARRPLLLNLLPSRLREGPGEGGGPGWRSGKFVGNRAWDGFGRFEARFGTESEGRKNSLKSDT